MIAPLPQGPFSIIYADPPWSYRDRALAGRRGAGCKYEVQSQDWICSLPVADIAARDCALFLWATMPKMDDALGVIRAWGFKYKTCAFTWVKRNKIADSWAWGMGRWTRANAELCLLATRGKPHRAFAGVHSVVDARIGRHSAKPPEVRDRIVRLMGDLPRVELFAREHCQGWISWGNELEVMPWDE